MKDLRSKRARINILVSPICQIVTLICGLIMPRLLIGAFGAETYGATASIAQFLAYITLLEGGIGGVARAALYKPLADNDIEKVSAIVAEIKRFFRVVAYIFVAYVLVLAVSFKKISGIVSLDWLSTSILVIVISLSTFGQYFIGISNAVLLQASQKTYVSNIISVTATVLNTLLVLFLVSIGCNIIVVKLISSCIFVMRPISLWLYVRKNYSINKCKKNEEIYLKQKYTGLGQHIAYFLHSNTSVVVLTWIENLVSVAIYSVYNMVVSQIQNITASFSAGMEAVFGDMLAKEEYDDLQKTFGRYETLISSVSVFLFSCTATLIVPFVKVYTKGLSDANYIAPAFAFLLTISSLIYCLRMPYHSLVIAAGHFKETKWAAYGEALVNVFLSVILVHYAGLIGVAIGTLVATLFRFIYYVVYLSNHIFCRKMSLLLKRGCINTVTFMLVFIVGNIIIYNVDFSNYTIWFLYAVIVAILSLILTICINFCFYRSDFTILLNKFAQKR